MPLKENPAPLLGGKADEAAKWETVRRLRYGALLKLFRDRWGYVLPDDDAGRSDLFELIMNISLAPAAVDKKMVCAIETWALWMQPDEANEMVGHINRLTIYERTPTARELGNRLRLTNAERERLRLWPIAPFDKTDEELVAQRKARERDRRARKRWEQGVRTRATYLSALSKRPRPWEAEGVSRSTWYNRRKRALDELNPDIGRGESETIVTKQRPYLVQSQKGIHEGVNFERLRTATGVRTKENNEPSSPEPRTHLVQPPQSSLDARMRALGNWGANAKRKHWTKPTILSDEPRDFREFPLEREVAA